MSPDRPGFFRSESRCNDGGRVNPYKSRGNPANRPGRSGGRSRARAAGALGLGTPVQKDVGEEILHPVGELREHVALAETGERAVLGRLKAAAGRALDATVGAIRTSLKKGGMVTLVGFGTFYVGKRAARSGRNPRTGATIKIKSARVPKFRAGKALKDAVN